MPEPVSLVADPQFVPLSPCFPRLESRNLNDLALISYRFPRDVAGGAVGLDALRQQQGRRDRAGADAPGQHDTVEHELASRGLT